MERIVLATGAGVDARVLHVAAMRRAEEAGAALALVHVIDGVEYPAQPEAMQHAIRSETEWLLSTMLHLAADRSGVDKVETSIHVRNGDVADEVVEFVSSTRPGLVMLGVPRSADHSTFDGQEFAEFVDRLERTGVRVEQVETA